WTTAATGEVMPGLSIELRVPSTSIVAGALATAQFVVRNASAEEVSISPYVAFARAGPPSQGTPDPREFRLMPRTGPPGAFDTRVAPGQTRSTYATTPLPFDVSGTITLHAQAGGSRGHLGYPVPFPRMV